MPGPRTGNRDLASNAFCLLTEPAWLPGALGNLRLVTKFATCSLTEGECM